MSCIVFTPDGDRVVLGTTTGRIFVWKIGAAQPDLMISEMPNWIFALAVSSDQPQLLVASITPLAPNTFSSQGPVSIHSYDLQTGQEKGSSSAKGLDPHITFHPAGRVFAVTTSWSQFTLHDARTLEVLFTSERDFLRPLRPSSQPAFFFPAADNSSVDVLAIGRRWNIDKQGHASLIAEYADQPDAIRSAPEQGLFADEGSLNSSSFIFQKYLTPPEIVAASPDRLTIYDRHQVLPRMGFDQLEWIPASGANQYGWMVAKNGNGILVLNLDDHTCRRLIFFNSFNEADTRCVAVSADFKKIAGCGTWGAAVWDGPTQGK